MFLIMEVGVGARVVRVLLDGRGEELRSEYLSDVVGHVDYAVLSSKYISLSDLAWNTTCQGHTNHARSP